MNFRVLDSPHQVAILPLLEDEMEDLRALRTMAGLTQIALARLSGVSRMKLSLSECGEAELTREEQIALREALLCTLRARASSIKRVLTQAVQQPAAM